MTGLAGGRSNSSSCSPFHLFYLTYLLSFFSFLSIVETILKYQSSNKLSLRLQAHLLLGLVRIYQRQVQYLLEDSKVAVTKLKEKEKTATTVSAPAKARNIDLQKEQTSVAQITLRPAEMPLESQDIDIGEG
jgi:hypothetical protein